MRNFYSNGAGLRVKEDSAKKEEQAGVCVK